MNQDRILSYQTASQLSSSELDQVNGADSNGMANCMPTYHNNAIDLQCEFN